jgi:acetyl esterase
VLGDASMADLDNERLMRELSLTVVSIDYRLAPEHPFPAASDDCLTVTAQIVEETVGPLLIGGSSAGGYLAAVTILRVRDELDAAGRFVGCVFNAGYFDCSGTPSARGSRPSQIPDVLDDGLMPLIAACYLPNHHPGELRNPQVSPLYASLHDLPPALFSVGSADHLLDDSMFMAARWEVFGNHAELAVYPDATHGSMTMGTALGQHAKQRRLAFIERVLHSAS